MNEELIAELEAEREEAPEVVEKVPEVEGKAPESEEGFQPWDDGAAKPKEGEEVPEEFQKLEASERWRVERLNKEIDAKREVQAKLAEREKELADLRAKVAPEAPAKPKTAEDLVNITKYPDTAEGAKAYLADLRAAERQIASEGAAEVVRKELAQRDYQKAVADQITEITKAYDSRMEEAKARNPAITKAEAYIDARAERVDANVLRELMMDENVGDVMHAIYSDHEKAKTFFTGNPAAALRLIHKESARAEFSRDTTKPAAKAVEREEKPKAVDMAPKLPRGAGGSGTTDPNKMSMSELKKLVLKR